MLLFSTILPIKDTLTKDGFIQLVIDWNQGSIYETNIIHGIQWHGERNIKFGDDRLWLSIDEYRNKNIIAVRYEKKQDDGVIWDTDYIMNFDEMKMSVRLDRSYLAESVIMGAEFSAPAFIRSLIMNGYIQDDGNIPVDYRPMFVDESNVSIIADVMNGKIRYHLPIVYISKTFAGSDPVDIWDLAKKLKGVAHVFVQKDSESGSTLRRLTDNKNEYNGAIGLYFPNDKAGHIKFLHHEFTDSDKKQAEKVVERILSYSASQQLDMLYTWDGVNNALLRDRYSSKRDELEEAQKKSQMLEAAAQLNAMEAESMRKEAEEKGKLARENEELVESVDEELNNMRQQIERLTRQNDALSAEIMGLRGRMERMGTKPVLYFGSEEEYFADEIKEFVLGAVDNELKNTIPNTRKSDVLGDILRSNGGFQNLLDKRGETVKSILRGYKNLSGTKKKDLEELGFTLSKDGGHYKLRYKDDGRYMVTLAATPSDNRTGDNVASEIIQNMF